MNDLGFLDFVVIFFLTCAGVWLLVEIGRLIGEWIDDHPGIWPARAWDWIKARAPFRWLN